jgi:hypothetical protein
MRTLKESLIAYKAELKKYKKWTDEMKKIYGETSSPLESWSNQDYHRIEEWDSRVRLVEKILGLTKDEVKKYCKEVGIVSGI